MIFVVLAGVGGLHWFSRGAEKEGPPQASPGPGAGEQPLESAGQTLTLYFGDKEAMYLEPEVRVVPKNGRSLAELAVLELIKGPSEEGHSVVIPPETRLLGVKVKDEIAYVDFSQEFKTKHWGGSAGELMTIFSVTNTLTELEGINKVQFLIEGKRTETLAGHFALNEPVSRDASLIRNPGSSLRSTGRNR